MTNPNDSVGTNGAYGGRTSVNALNDVLASFTGRGVLSGWAVTASSGMTVNVGGSAGVRDVAIAEDNAGNRTTVDNRSSSPISVTLSAASSSSTRVDYIVAYVNNPATVLVTTIDNPSTCGIIAVNGTTSAPDESAIRAAITADGGTGSTAYYVVLATITIAAGTTDLTDSNIAQGVKASSNADYVAQETQIGTWIDGSPVYRSVLQGTYNVGSAESIAQVTTLSNVDKLISISGWIANSDARIAFGTAHRSQDNVIISDSFAMTIGGSLIVRCYSRNAANNLAYCLIVEYTKPT